jgi:hypothetical protein
MSIFKKENEFLDPLDQPGDLSKAKIHGRSQKVLNLDDFDPKGSNNII